MEELAPARRKGLGEAVQRWCEDGARVDAETVPVQLEHLIPAGLDSRISKPPILTHGSRGVWLHLVNRY